MEENVTSSDNHYDYYAKSIITRKSEISVKESLRDHISTEMAEKLRIMADSNPPIPDGDLIAYEQATNDVLTLLDQEIEYAKIRLKTMQDDFTEYKSMIAGTDSSEEIEEMNRWAKANTRRSKRSRYYPDTGTNYALDA